MTQLYIQIRNCIVYLPALHCWLIPNFDITILSSTVVLLLFDSGFMYFFVSACITYLYLHFVVAWVVFVFEWICICICSVYITLYCSDSDQWRMRTGPDGFSMPAPSTPLASSSSVFYIHANAIFFLNRKMQISFKGNINTQHTNTNRKIGKCKYKYLLKEITICNTQIQTSPSLFLPAHSPQAHPSFIFMQIQIFS